MTDRQGAAVPFEDLLAHAPWLRRVARTLVREPGAAEDVVQETWLTALRCPPAEAENLRGWLGRTLRNLVWQRARSERSRTEREQRERRDGDAPLSPEALVQGAEMQRLLAEEVMRLREPFRTTVLRRYYEGFEPARIAELERVPAGTVRWRLKRGLELLREQMDQHAERDTWRLGLLALVGAESIETGSDLLAVHSLLRPLPLSGPPTTALVAVGTVAAAALLAVAGGLRPDEDQPPPVEPPRVAALAALDAGRIPLGPRPGTWRSEGNGGASEPGIEVLRGVARVGGRVLRLDPAAPRGFVPAAGAEVLADAAACERPGDAETGGAPVARLAARCDEEGRFELSVALGGDPAAGRGVAVVLRAVGDDRHAGGEARVLLPAGSTDARDDVELLLVPHGALVGETLDSGGHPLDGVELLFATGTARSDEHGRFWLADYAGARLLGVRLSGRPASADAVLRSRADGSWTSATVTLDGGVTLASARPRESRRPGGPRASSSPMLSSRGEAWLHETTSMRMQRHRVGNAAARSTPGPGESSWSAASIGRELSTAVGSLRRAGIRSARSAESAWSGSRREGALLLGGPGVPGVVAGVEEALPGALLLAEACVHGSGEERAVWCSLGLHAVDPEPEAFLVASSISSSTALPSCRALIEELGSALAVALPPDLLPDGGGVHPGRSGGHPPRRTGHADSPPASPQTDTGTVVEPAGARSNS